MGWVNCRRCVVPTITEGGEPGLVFDATQQSKKTILDALQMMAAPVLHAQTMADTSLCKVSWCAFIRRERMNFILRIGTERISYWKRSENRTYCQHHWVANTKIESGCCGKLSFGHGVGVDFAKRYFGMKLEVEVVPAILKERMKQWRPSVLYFTSIHHSSVLHLNTATRIVEAFKECQLVFSNSPLTVCNVTNIAIIGLVSCYCVEFIGKMKNRITGRRSTEKNMTHLVEKRNKHFPKCTLWYYTRTLLERHLSTANNWDLTPHAIFLATSIFF